MILYFSILVFILGLIVGSFLNSFITRYQTGLGYGGRSFCFSCGHKLSFRDLIPILSFIFQKGRCRYCGARLSLQYPLVEVVTGLVFVFVIIKLGFFLSPLYFLLSTFYLFIFSILVAIVFYDIRHKIIPNALVYLFIALSFSSIFFNDFLLQTTNHKLQALSAGPIVAAPLFLLWLISAGKWIGLGDSKLALGTGWFLGVSGGFTALILGTWIGAAVGILFIIGGKMFRAFPYLSQRFKRFTMKSEIPFAPFIILGTLIVFFCDISFADIQSLFMF
ncbi:MAG: prepilin peptidase [Parcubacteria group bacterium]|nr:prepilin peptidase [Parcubacteria group bacterium]